METISRQPSNFRVFNGSDNNSSGLETGAITSPMAASFREEKLALPTISLTVAPSPDSTPSAYAEGDRK